MSTAPKHAIVLLINITITKVEFDAVMHLHGPHRTVQGLCQLHIMEITFKGTLLIVNKVDPRVWGSKQYTNQLFWSSSVQQPFTIITNLSVPVKINLRSSRRWLKEEVCNIFWEVMPLHFSGSKLTLVYWNDRYSGWIWSFFEIFSHL